MGGHLRGKTTEMLNGGAGKGVVVAVVVGGVGCKEQEEAKTLVLLDYEGVESVARKACFCQKRQDSDKLSSLCSQLPPNPHTHTHTL